MMQISLLAYLVAGTFLDMFYFDLTYHLVGLTVALETVALAATVRSPEEGQRPDVDESWWLRKPDGQFEVA